MRPVWDWLGIPKSRTGAPGLTAIWRRGPLAALAVVIALLLGSGMVVAATGPPFAHDSRAAGASGPGPGPGEVVTTPVTDAGPDAVPAQAVAPHPGGSSPAVSGPSARPTTTVGQSGSRLRTSPGSYGPHLPGSVDVPFSSGQSTWTGVSRGITLTLHIDPVGARAGDPLQFTMEASSETEPCCSLYLYFGDGYGFDTNSAMTCPDGGPQSPGTVRKQTVHSYNAHGRWEFMLGASTGNCRVEPKYGELYGTLEIAPGASSGQGPTLPTGWLAQTLPIGDHEPDLTWLSVVAEGQDEDGWVRGMVLDWGDGTPPLALRGDAFPCRPSLSGWPLPSQATTVTDVAPRHHYSAPGTHVITLTVFSTACDGSDVQQATASMPYPAVPGGPFGPPFLHAP